MLADNLFKVDKISYPLTICGILKETTEKIKERLTIKDEAQLLPTKSLCQLRVTCRYEE